MAYKIDKNKGGSRYTARTFSLSTKESNDARSIGAPNYEFYELEPAEVVDIILSDNHPDFESYKDIGKAKIRYITSENGKDQSLLTYAKPMNANIKDYPLIGEIVIGVKYLGSLYYTQRLNVSNNINQVSKPGASLPQLKRKYSTRKKASEYEDIYTSGTSNKKKESSDFKLGKVFIRNDNIKPIQPYEGDIIIEGRFGESIRLGSDQEINTPTMKIRVGQPNEVSNTFLQPIDEDFNLDQNSIWIGTNEEIPLNPSTIQSPIHLEFYDNKPNEFIGNQIFMNSDRIVLNTKENEFMTFAKRAINLVTEGVTTIDSVDDVTINTTSNTIINSNEIYLGSPNADEPVVLGETLKTILEEMIDYLISHKHATSTGPSGPPLPPELNQLQRWKTKIDSALSKRNYTV